MTLPSPPHRLLDACPTCARQYEVTHLAAGQDVRCECGSVFPARHVQPAGPRVLRCSSCGANLREHARACDFCKAEITLEERQKGAVCPLCLARARIDARFCAECGTGLAPQALNAVPAESTCPRCEGGLRSRSLGESAVIECGACGGLWLEPGELEAVCLRAERQLPVVRARDAASVSRFVDEARYLPCLRCGDRMVRRGYGGSGVVIDVCRDHGVWLDRGEMERIVEWVRAGGNARSVSSPPPRQRPARPSYERSASRTRTRSQRFFAFVSDVFDSVLGR